MSRIPPFHRPTSVDAPTFFHAPAHIQITSGLSKLGSVSEGYLASKTGWVSSIPCFIRVQVSVVISTHYRILHFICYFETIVWIKFNKCCMHNTTRFLPTVHSVFSLWRNLRILRLITLDAYGSRSFVKVIWTFAIFAFTRLMVEYVQVWVGTPKSHIYYGNPRATFFSPQNYNLLSTVFLLKWVKFAEPSLERIGCIPERSCFWIYSFGGQISNRCCWSYRLSMCQPHLCRMLSRWNLLKCLVRVTLWS